MQSLCVNSASNDLITHGLYENGSRELAGENWANVRASCSRRSHPRVQLVLEMYGKVRSSSTSVKEALQKYM